MKIAYIIMQFFFPKSIYKRSQSISQGHPVITEEIYYRELVQKNRKSEAT